MTLLAQQRAELVERIARGLVGLIGGDPDTMVLHPAQKSWEEPSMKRWEAFEEEAEAALAAIHDAGMAVVPRNGSAVPITDAMVAVMNGDPAARIGVSDLEVAYEAMIAAADLSPIPQETENGQ